MPSAFQPTPAACSGAAYPPSPQLPALFSSWFYLSLNSHYSPIASSVSVAKVHFKNDSNHNPTNTRRGIMAKLEDHDYTKDDSDGHVDTREANKECEKPDPNLGCDPGIDVAG